MKKPFTVFKSGEGDFWVVDALMHLPIVGMLFEEKQHAQAVCDLLCEEIARQQAKPDKNITSFSN